MKKENIATLEMLLCAALWSIAGIFIKLIPWNGFAVAGMRSLIAGLTFAVYMLITKRRYICNKRTILGGVLAGSVYTCFTVANKLTTAANAIVLQFTAPVSQLPDGQLRRMVQGRPGRRGIPPPYGTGGAHP